jgi:hypothetical protein
MEHLVAVREDGAGRYTAQALGVPDVKGQGATEAEAIEQARQALAAWLASVKVVRVQVGLPGKTGNPWLDYFGYAKDDPDFQDYLDELKRAREAADLP